MKEQAIQIDTRRRDWISAVNERDIEAYLDLLSEDVVWLPPGQPAVCGRIAFRKWVTPFFQRFRYEFVLDKPTVIPTGDWAVERGRFETTMTPVTDGSPASHGGSYLVMWQRTGDGVWRINRYIDGKQLPQNAP